MQVKSYAEHFSLENVCQNAVLHCRAQHQMYFYPY